MFVGSGAQEELEERHHLGGKRDAVVQRRGPCLALLLDEVVLPSLKMDAAQGEANKGLLARDENQREHAEDQHDPEAEKVQPLNSSFPADGLPPLAQQLQNPS